MRENGEGGSEGKEDGGDREGVSEGGKGRTQS